MHHKISLYTDHILLFLQNPVISLQEINKILTNLQIFQNTQLIGINHLLFQPQSWNAAANTLPISLCTDHITYLGVRVSPRLSDLFTHPLKSVQEDLQRWTNHPLSIMGRIFTIKMTILPKVNYLLSMIPIQPTTSWFKSLDSAITKY